MSETDFITTYSSIGEMEKNQGKVSKSREISDKVGRNVNVVLLALHLISLVSIILPSFMVLDVAGC